jgi:hypothetical protein
MGESSCNIYHRPIAYHCLVKCPLPHRLKWVDNCKDDPAQAALPPEQISVLPLHTRYVKTDQEEGPGLTFCPLSVRVDDPCLVSFSTPGGLPSVHLRRRKVHALCKATLALDPLLPYGLTNRKSGAKKRPTYARVKVTKISCGPYGCTSCCTHSSERVGTKPLLLTRRCA